MEAIYSVIRSIVIFLLLAKILTFLMPDGHMKKYLRLFSGIVLMLIMLGPIIKYSGILEHMNYQIITQQFQISRMGEGIDYGQYNKTRDETTMNIYKDKITKHIERILDNDNIVVKHTEVMVEENVDSEEYGMIKSVYLTVSNIEETKKKGSIKVQPVKVDQVIIGEKNRDIVIKTTEDIILEKKIKKIMNNFYNLSSDNIHIIIETC